MRPGRLLRQQMAARNRAYEPPSDPYQDWRQIEHHGGMLMVLFRIMEQG